MQETLHHAVQRMRSQGFNDHQIAGQIHRWHAGWTPGQVSAVLYEPAHVTKAQDVYHGTSTKPFYPGQKPDHFQPAGRGGGIPVYKLGVGTAGPTGDKALGTVLGAPARGRSEGQTQATLGKVYRQNHPLGQQLIEGVANTVPGVAVAKGIRDSHVNFGTLGNEAFNDVTSGLLPVGKAAALFGGLRGLRKAHEAATALEDVGKVAKVAEAPAPTTLFRGTKPGGARVATGHPEWDKHLFATDSEENARLYGPNIERMVVKPEARVLRHGTPEWDKIAAKTSTKDWAVKTLANAKAAGYDIVAFKDQGALGTVVMNPDSVVRNVGHPAALDPLERAAHLPPEAEQLRAVLSGRAAKEALPGMGSYEKAGAKSDPLFGTSAESAYKVEEGLRSQERAARFRKADKAFSDPSLDPSEAVRRWKHEMSGELPKIKWRGFDELSPESVKAMTRYAAYEAPHLTGSMRARAVDTLERALDGTVPRPHELAILEHIFGKDVANGFSQFAKDPFRETIIGILNIPRTLMASMDFSAPLRQGLVIGTRHPITTGKNFAAMFKSFGSEKSFQALGDEIKSRATYPLMLEADLPLTGLDRGIGNAEEAFQGLSVTEKFTGGKRFSPVRMSDRAYTGFLVKTRADVFDLLIRQAESQGRDVHDAKFLHDLGRFIGNATGRGTFDHKALEQAMPLLNIGLFSPRLIASRLQLLNPAYYVKLDPFVRRQALSAALTTFGSISTVLGLAAAAGAKAGTDWRSSDFGKIRIGNTRIDIGGGFNQYFHLLGEVVTGQRINSSTGELTSLRHPKFGQQSMFDVGVNFARGKESPTFSIATDWLTGKSGIGQPFTTKAEIKSHFLPLIWQDAHDLYNHPFHGMNGIEAALLGYGVGMFGTGLQTYEQKPSKTSGNEPDPLEGGLGLTGGDPLEGGPGLGP